MSLTARDDWPKDGPGVHKSQIALREYASEMAMCTDEDELDALIGSKRALMRLAFEHNEAWWESLKVMEQQQRSRIREDRKYVTDNARHW